MNIITAVCGESCWHSGDEHWASRELRKAERKKQRFLQSSALQWQFSKALLRDSGVCKQLQLPRPQQKSSYLWLVSEGSSSLGKPRGNYSATLKRPMVSNGDFKPLTTETIFHRRADPGNHSYKGPLAGAHVDGYNWIQGENNHAHLQCLCQWLELLHRVMFCDCHAELKINISLSNFSCVFYLWKVAAFDFPENWHIAN